MPTAMSSLMDLPSMGWRDRRRAPRGLSNDRPGAWDEHLLPRLHGEAVGHAGEEVGHRPGQVLSRTGSHPEAGAQPVPVLQAPAVQVLEDALGLLELVLD